MVPIVFFFSPASWHHYCYRQCDLRWPDLVYREETWYEGFQKYLYFSYRFVSNSMFFFSGGKHHRFKRGYKNVIDEAIRLVRFIVLLYSNTTMVGINEFLRDTNTLGHFFFPCRIFVYIYDIFDYS